MSRTTVYKSFYFAIVGGAPFLIVWLTVHFRLSIWEFVGLVLLMFVPGRILGFFWRDLLRGLRLLKLKQHEESKRHSAAFLEELKLKPWLKKLIWLGSGSYSRDPEAMALNNIGAAEIGLGNFESASTHLKASIAVDAHNPLPYYNLGVLSRMLGDGADARRRFAEAKSRGFSRSVTDRIVMKAQSRLAKTDGRGPS